MQREFTQRSSAELTPHSMDSLYITTSTSTSTSTASPLSPTTTSSPSTLHTPSPSQEAMLSPPQESEHLRRQRTTMACDFCIKRKIRCSGNQPGCDQCTRRERPCVFSRQPRTRPRLPNLQ